MHDVAEIRGRVGGVTFTEKQLQVIELLGQGKSTEQIGDEMGLSKFTIISHRETIRRKLGGVPSREIPYAFSRLNGSPLAGEDKGADVTHRAGVTDSGAAVYEGIVNQSNGPSVTPPPSPASSEPASATDNVSLSPASALESLGSLPGRNK